MKQKVMPNPSPEPPAVGTINSADAVCVAIGGGSRQGH
jgi:hypothetical protein